MKIRILIGLVFVFGSTMGCGGPEENVTIVENLPGPTELFKKALEDAINTGTPIGSGGFALQSYAEQIGKDDPAKAQALIKGIDELAQITDPAKVKTKAKELLGKL